MNLSSKEIKRREKTRVAKERAKELKKLGAIHFSLRKTLTPQQQSAVTRQYHKYADIINRPYDFGTKILPATRAKKITTAAFTTGKGKKRKVWIYKKPNEQLVWGDTGYDLIGTGYRESVPDSLPAWDEKRVRKVFKNLKEDQFVMLRQGAHTPIRFTFHDLESFISWVEEYARDSKNNTWLGDLSVLTVAGGIPDHMESKRKHTRRRSPADMATRKAWKKTPKGKAQKKESEKRRIARRKAESTK